MLQAGVIPQLLANGHLPLLVSTSAERLETSIKKQLLPNIGDMEFLEVDVSDRVRSPGE